MKTIVLVTIAALMAPIAAASETAPTRPRDPGAARGTPLPQGRDDQLDPSPIDPAIDPNVDMFLGDYRAAKPRTIFGGLAVRDILTRLEGPDRLHPTRRGAVLEVLTWIGQATLQPGATAGGRVQADQRQLYYTTGGVGRIVVRGQTYDVREGTGFTLTPEFDFQLTATGAAPLTFIARAEPLPDNYRPSETFLIGNRFSNDRRLGIHWAHIGTGSAGGVGLQTIAPYSMPQPHSHSNEEVWIQVKGETVLSIGKSLRPMIPGQAIRIPPTGLTAHSSINMGAEPVEMMVVIPYGTASPLDYAQLDGTAFDPAKDPDVDMFRGHWRDAFPRIMHGNLYFRDMLTRLQGPDPVHPTRTGAVLRNAGAVSYAMLEPGSTAHPVEGELKGAQQVFVVNSGAGTITVGGRTVALAKDMAFIVPPAADFRLTASGERYITFYVVTETLPDGTAPATAVKVIDNRKAPTVVNAWVSRERPLVTKADGLVQYRTITAAEVQPKAMTRPYSVSSGGEEVWIATEGDTDVLLGKQLRRFPAGGAFAVPPTGRSAQTKLNLSNSPARFIYVSK